MSGEIGWEPVSQPASTSPFSSAWSQGQVFDTYVASTGDEVDGIGLWGSEVYDNDIWLYTVTSGLPDDRIQKLGSFSEGGTGGKKTAAVSPAVSLTNGVEYCVVQHTTGSTTRIYQETQTNAYSYYNTTGDPPDPWTHDGYISQRLAIWADVTAGGGGGRIMGSLAGSGGLAGLGGLAGRGGGLAG